MGESRINLAGTEGTEHHAGLLRLKFTGSCEASLMVTDPERHLPLFFGSIHVPGGVKAIYRPGENAIFQPRR